MSKTVTVTWMDGETTEFIAVDVITESRSVLRLESKAYRSLPYRSDVVHVASIPYTSIKMWTERTEA